MRLQGVGGGLSGLMLGETAWFFGSIVWSVSLLVRLKMGSSCVEGSTEGNCNSGGLWIMG